MMSGTAGMLPGTIRCCQRLPGATNVCQMMPMTARCCQVMFPSNAGQMITSAVASPHNQRERERKKERDTNMSLTNLII